MSDKILEILDSGRSDCILLVEDDRSVRTVITLLLERAGYFVISASSRTEAIQIWKALSSSFGLVITDLCSAEHSNHTLIAELALLGATIPVLVMSSPIYEQQIREAAASAPIDFIAKPFNPDTLLARVWSLMQQTSPGIV